MILVVDDYEPWRRFVSSTVGQLPELQVVGEASDGFEAVQKSQELQPDLILLDIGLPRLNGIEVARRIREVSPSSKIVFVSDNSSADIAEEALSTGAGGYVVKSDTGRELLPALKAVLAGKRFVSSSLAGLNRPPDPQTGARLNRYDPATLNPTPNVSIAHHHEVQFYSDDRQLLDHATRFLGAALNAGNAAIIVATESHRNTVRSELQASGIDIGAAITQGRYIDLDFGETVSMFLVDGMPDPVRFLKLFGTVIEAASEAAKGSHPCVSAFSECAPLVWRQGNPEGAIQIEKLANQLIEKHGLAILCGYRMSGIESAMENDVYQRICTEHSAVYPR